VLDLHEILDGTEKMLRRLIGEDIDLETATAPDLGLVYVDPAQIEQVVLNLAVNARDAMPKGGNLTINVENAILDEDYSRLHTDVKTGSYVMMEVSDTGCGMDEETLSRIFEPFFTTKEQGKGTGLGLSTVYGIVKQGGGHIGVDSEVGKGTVFKIYLPRVDVAGRADLPDVPGAGILVGSETVLVAEDDESVRRIAVRILEEHQYSVLEAHDGEEAMERCELHQGVIDLLLTDLIMPGMDGKELAGLVRAHRPEIKVAFMSG
jgi:CheY-like chemotaxis protein